jgi:hypothetical protein
MILRKNNAQYDYFLWLCDLIEGGSDYKHREFLNYLHQKEFYPNLPNDDNRAEDGKKLREEYFYGILEEDYPVWGTPCTMLEMLIALSQKIEFILSDDDMGDRTSKWFWEMIDNLGLEKFSDNDPNILSKTHRNNVILDIFHRRAYRRNGEGGLFPLKRHPIVDQRNVEIWYQMQSYIQECC